jgi:Ca-activated chloride channel family protein
MTGTPLRQAKTAIETALGMLKPEDTFQLVEFSQNASAFGSRPLSPTPQNLRDARRWVDDLQAGGGTMMLDGIRAALDVSHDPERLRYVVFLTDGFIGNETEVFGEVHRRLGASRIFSFGIGSSVNRHLLEGLAHMGNGTMTVLLENEDATKTMRVFMERVRRPIMHDVRIDWRGASITQVFPARLPDLHPGRPVYVVGRAWEPRSVPIAIEGRAGSRHVRLDATLDLARHSTNPGIAKVCAKSQIAELSWASAREGSTRALSEEILAIALRNGILSSATAFIAVDSSRPTDGQSGTTVHQGVPVPRGVQYETSVSDR